MIEQVSQRQREEQLAHVVVAKVSGLFQNKIPSEEMLDRAWLAALEDIRDRGGDGINAAKEVLRD
jgi:hypothetical protein